MQPPLPDAGIPTTGQHQEIGVYELPWFHMGAALHSLLQGVSGISRKESETQKGISLLSQPQLLLSLTTPTGLPAPLKNWIVSREITLHLPPQIGLYERNFVRLKL